MLEESDYEEDESVGGEGYGTGLTGGIVESSLTGPGFDEDAEGSDEWGEGTVCGDET